MSISNAKPKEQAKQQPKKVIKAASVAYLQVKFKDNDNQKGFKIKNFDKELNKVEQYLDGQKNRWSWAMLREVGSNAIYHYYHPNTGIDRLDLDTYKEQFTAYSLYIIPTSSYKRKTGITKGSSQRIYDLEQIDKYWTKDVLRIDVYVEGKKVNSYENGRLLK
jgi:hypothetical protein